jgi:hypothetical protein
MLIKGRGRRRENGRQEDRARENGRQETELC